MSFMPRPVALLGLPLLLTSLVHPLGPGPASAQATGSVQGIVVDAYTGRPLEGVEIRIADPEVVVRTDADGAFRFASLPARPLVLSARLAGYVAFTDRIVVPRGRAQRLEIRMETVAAALEELRVHATRADPAPAGRTGAAPPGADPLDGELLTVFRPTSVGGGTAFLIRGLKTMTGHNDPAIFVDGIRVLDSGGAAGSRGSGPGILDLIPTESIDSIRVLRGPSAAARYGPETANGVILVYTKHGRGSGGGAGRP